MKLPPGGGGDDIFTPTDIIAVDGEVVNKCFEHEDSILFIIDSFRRMIGDYKRENKEIDIPIMDAAIKISNILETSIHESLNLLFCLSILISSRFLVGLVRNKPNSITDVIQLKKGVAVC